jgi:hypothetical protein
MKYFALILCLTMLLSGCTIGENWTGFYYPDGLGYGIDESKWQIQDGFISKNACLDWVDSVMGNKSDADYECGSDCRFDTDWNSYLCKTTEQ